MNTPREAGIEERTVIAPEGGWQEGVWLVEVAYEPANVIHRAVFWLSMLDEEEPNEELMKYMDYTWDKDFDPIRHPNNWIHGSYENPQPIEEIHYLKGVKLLADKKELRRP